MVGALEVLTGPMFSGKTTELVNRLKKVCESGGTVIVFKPAIDTRYSKDQVVSHDGISFPAQAITPGQETFSDIVDKCGGMLRFESTTVIAFDEANFLTGRFPRLCDKLVSKGKRVIVAGLDMTFSEEPFGPMPDIMATADKLDKLTAICAKCGGVATRSQRLVDGKPAPKNWATILVGGIGTYEARCRSCFVCE